MVDRPSRGEVEARIANAALCHLAGQPVRARRQFDVNAARFMEPHRVEANNITEHGEREMSEDVDRRFSRYCAHMRRLINEQQRLSPGLRCAFYLAVLEPGYEALKDRARRILIRTRNAILRANARAKADAQRASLTAVVATLGVLAVAILVAERMVGIALAAGTLGAYGAPAYGRRAQCS